MTRMSINGIELNVDQRGDGPGILMLHGFTGDVSTWDPFIDVWDGWQKVRIDLIGHGASDSPADPERYSMEHAVNDIVEVMDQLGSGSMVVIGYSLGARVAMHFALEVPEAVWALILESGSPGIEDERERQRRMQSDLELAARIEKEGIEKFVDYWQSQPLFATQSKLPADVFERQRRQRLAGSPAGLANSLRGMSQGRQEYLLPYMTELMMPVMLITGEQDQAYTNLARQMSWTLPTSVLEIIPNAGHTVHLEQPELFGGIVKRFLDAARPLPEVGSD
jgi:2-succinyl-6-hydroxy-2,4-cyclohexadiene-1-carboxylate synthase